MSRSMRWRLIGGPSASRGPFAERGGGLALSLRTRLAVPVAVAIPVSLAFARGRGGGRGRRCRLTLLAGPAEPFAHRQARLAVAVAEPDRLAVGRTFLAIRVAVAELGGGLVPLGAPGRGAVGGILRGRRRGVRRGRLAEAGTTGGLPAGRASFGMAAKTPRTFDQQRIVTPIVFDEAEASTANKGIESPSGRRGLRRNADKTRMGWSAGRS
ncbi:MAG: hypothetical protein U0794_11295 [Isosphaeraceae bacterium]